MQSNYVGIVDTGHAEGIHMVKNLLVRAPVLVYENEGRACDNVERSPPPRDPLCERCFTGTQISSQTNQIGEFQQFAKTNSNSNRLFRAMTLEIETLPF